MTSAISSRRAIKARDAITMIAMCVDGVTPCVVSMIEFRKV